MMIACDWKGELDAMVARGDRAIGAFISGMNALSPSSRLTATWMQRCPLCTTCLHSARPGIDLNSASARSQLSRIGRLEKLAT